MPKSKILDKMYIRIEPASNPWNPIRLCDLEHIVSQIVRHVDGVTLREVDIVSEYDYYCSYCDAKWTEDSPTYNGGCCAKDQEHDPAYPAPNYRA
jgi:hypothetical protein